MLFAIERWFMGQKADICWRSRLFRNGDEQAIIDLYTIAINRNIEMCEWKWMFQNGPAGPAILHLADDDGILAGQYAIIKANLQIQGISVQGAQSFDTMTHPDYRKQGVFVTLAKDVYACAASQGVQLIYGFPNMNSLHGFTKHLNFFNLDDLPVVWRPLRTWEMLQLKVKNRLFCRVLGKLFQTGFNLTFPIHPKSGSALEIQKAVSFPPIESNDLFHRLSMKFPNMVVRDWKFLKWRYEDNPRFNYDIYLAWRGKSLDGYCVTRYSEQHGLPCCHIVDIFSDPVDRLAINGLLTHSLNEATKRTATAFCLLPRTSPFMPYLKRLGFIFTRRKVPYILRINSDEISRSMIDNIEQWHISYGDADFV